MVLWVKAHNEKYSLYAFSVAAVFSPFSSACRSTSNRLPERCAFFVFSLFLAHKALSHFPRISGCMLSFSGRIRMGRTVPPCTSISLRAMDTYIFYYINISLYTQVGRHVTSIRRHVTSIRRKTKFYGFKSICGMASKIKMLTGLYERAIIFMHNL